MPTESSKARSVTAEIARRPAASPKIVARGARSTGGAWLGLPVPAKEFTQRISGIRRVTCRMPRMIPIRRTPRIRPFRPGFAMKAVAICR